jgi:hypothetical protein
MTHHQPWSIPKHRKDALIWTDRAEVRERLRRAPKCPHCRKRQFRTKGDARSFLALIIASRGDQAQPDDYQLKPYPCPWGNGWHVGHDRKLKELLNGGHS